MHQPTLDRVRLILRPFTLTDAPTVQCTGDAVTFAIVLHATSELCGAIGLHVNQRHQHAEMGYWMAVPAKAATSSPAVARR